MAKRPLKGSDSNYNVKKQKHDFDNFRPPTTSSSNVPHFLNNQPRQPNVEPQNSRITLRQNESIIDKETYFDDDEDDDVLLMASQCAEDDDVLMMVSQCAEEEDRRRQLETTVTEFNPPSSGTSTQFPVYIDKRKELPQIKESELSQNSQKENFAASQRDLMKKHNDMKELLARIDRLTTTNKELRENLLLKEGEAKNLRLSKKAAEDKLTKMRHEKLESANLSRIDPEKDALRREVAKLKTERDFSKLDDFKQKISSTLQQPPVVIREVSSPLSNTKFFTNFSMNSQSMPEVLPMMFEAEESLPVPPESLKDSLERDSTEDVVKSQLKLAQIHTRIIAGGKFSDALIDEIFTDAVFMIFRIDNFIKYLEIEEESLYTFDSHPALSAAAAISIPELREKLTKVNLSNETIFGCGGKISIFQAEKFFPEELCAKPRRIIAFYASLAKNSRKFSEKLLIDNVVDDENHRTFVSVLTDTLLSRVSQSKNVYDYYGLTMAVGSLLSSLGSHYSKYSNNQIIDIALVKLLRAVLHCRCDNPILMVHVAQFVADTSLEPSIISQLCVNFPTSEITEISRTYRHFKYPHGACTFQLFLSYLLTTFKSKNNLNSFELELLMETLLNLNKIKSNVQEVSLGIVKFLNCSQANMCGCLQQLTNTTLTLNYHLLANQNCAFMQSIPAREISNISTSIDEQKFHKHHRLIKELTKRGVIMIRDLFRVLEDFTDYPVNNLVFSNRLEQFWDSIKRGSCLDVAGNSIDFLKSLHFNEFELDALKAISLQPNLMKTDEDEDQDEEMEILASDEEPDSFFIDLCRVPIDEYDENPM